MMNLYRVYREDFVDYGEFDEFTVVAKNGKAAVALATSGLRYGTWVWEKIPLKYSRIVTSSFNAG